MKDKQQQVIEGNRIISDFMDVRFSRFAKYHYSWDALMPVVEKIFKIATSADAPNKITENRLFKFSIGAPREDVYKAAIEAIEWYNKNK